MMSLEYLVFSLSLSYDVTLFSNNFWYSINNSWLRGADDGVDSNCVVPTANIEYSNVGSSEEHGSVKSFPTKSLQNHGIIDCHLEKVLLHL